MSMSPQINTKPARSRPPIEVRSKADLIGVLMAALDAAEVGVVEDSVSTTGFVCLLPDGRVPITIGGGRHIPLVSDDDPRPISDQFPAPLVMDGEGGWASFSPPLDQFGDAEPVLIGSDEDDEVRAIARGFEPRGLHPND